MNRLSLKTTLKSIVKYPGVSLINWAGLAIGLTVCGFIALFLQHESRFDRFHPNAERIYRLNTTLKYPNSPERPTAMASIMMGPFLQRESGAVEDYLRIVSGSEDFLVHAETKQTAIKKSLVADLEFFTFFNFPLRYGDSESALKAPQGIVISRAVSEQLFGQGNPIGKIIDFSYTLTPGRDTTERYPVTGVFETLPLHSHLQFDAVFPLDEKAYQWDVENRWHSIVTNTYLRLRPGQTEENAAAFEKLLPKEMPNSQMIGLSLQPLSEVHLGSMKLEYDLNNFQRSDRKYVYVLGFVAVFILLIGSINFTNLYSVLANRRMKEVAVRKSIGASRGDVIRQFLGESLLLASLAGVAAIGAIGFLKDPFQELMGRSLDMETNLFFVGGMMGLAALAGLAGGLIPALRLSNFSAARAFQQNATASSTKQPFISSLVVLQFSLSVVLIIGMVVCNRQLWFLRTKDLGYNTSQIVKMDLGLGNLLKYPTLKEALLKIPGVGAVSGSSHELGDIQSMMGLLVQNTETRAWENYPMNIIFADRNFFELHDMSFVHGEAPSLEGTETGREYVVNEAFLKKMGWKDNPVGQGIMRAGLPESEIGKIVGVVKDFHQSSLRTAIEPICIQASQVTQILEVKLAVADLSEMLPKLGAVWSQHIIDRPFDYEFLDEHFAALYAAEEQLGRSLLVATLLAIVIACMGLLGLSAFIIQQRTKEVGIRKVLGATVAGITGLLAKDFLKLVVVSILIASPVAYWLMKQWLADFAYRIEMQWWMFASAGAGALALAFLTVSFLSVKAALANPVESLRSE
ncbi:MAG: FtsX-like permease family protein [Saprospiraceae bacterium]